MMLILSTLDPTANAGILRDSNIASSILKFQYSAIIIGITAQNNHSVLKIEPVSNNMILAQMESIMNVTNSPIFVKIGLIPNLMTMKLLYKLFAHEYKSCKIILDPVISSSSGHNFLNHNEISFLRDKLIPLSYCVTPNIPELVQLLKISQNNINYKLLLQEFKDLGWKNILLKGGHSNVNNQDYCRDVLFSTSTNLDNFIYTENDINIQLMDNHILEYQHKKILNFENIRGTGCSLSTAIASYLYQNSSLPKAILESIIFIKAFLKNY